MKTRKERIAAYVAAGKSEDEAAELVERELAKEAAREALDEQSKAKKDADDAALAVKAAADVAAETALAGKKAEYEKELRTKWEAEQAAKITQPLAPVGAGALSGMKISVASPYDRLDTFDLALRYEVMRAYGKQPSERFFRALAFRAAKMASDEDTIGMKNGQPVKVPALDWNNLIPRNLDLTEVDEKLIASKIGQADRFSAGAADKAPDVITPAGLAQLHRLAIKADEVMYSTQNGYGDQWVPTLMNAQLWRTVRLNAAVLGLFTQFDMPSQPYDYPTESTDPTFYMVGETTGEAQLVLTGGPFTDSKIGTAKLTFSAGKLGAISYWTEEQEEDGIIAAEPQIRDQYGVKFGHAIDDVIINGDETNDNTNINTEGTDIADTSMYLILDGLRHEALITTATDSRDGTTLTIDDFGLTQALMGTAGKYGVNPADLVFLSDPAVWHRAKLLGEVMTLDKIGPMATVITGQLAGIFGSPYIVSEDYPLTDATGKVDDTAGDNVKGSFLAVNRRGVLVGWRRRPRVRVVAVPFAEAVYIMGSARLDIQYRTAGMVACTYDLTV